MRSSSENGRGENRDSSADRQGDSLYFPIEAWVRLSSSRLVCYRGFRIFPGNVFSVQSADFFDVPTRAVDLETSREQFMELLAEEAPEERSPVFPTFEEAIADHRRRFAWADETFE